MEGEGGGSGGAGTSGDSGDGGEQLLTVKHELRTGERPRPLPAGPASEARLRAGLGARAGQEGRELGGRARGGASWARRGKFVPAGTPVSGPAWEDAFMPRFLHR